MYSHIKGIVDELGADRAVIDAGGVGYELFCSKNTLKELALGKAAKLFAHLNISQDAVALYGFYTDDERAMFRKLIGVSRIGPKLALAALSVLSPDDISMAVLTDNAAAFDGVTGMGRKTAARVILELKDKVDSSDVSHAGMASDIEASSSSIRAESIAALVSLGYDGADAGRVVAGLDDCSSVEEMIKHALKEFSKR